MSILTCQEVLVGEIGVVGRNYHRLVIVRKSLSAWSYLHYHIMILHTKAREKRAPYLLG